MMYCDSGFSMKIKIKINLDENALECELVLVQHTYT
jgi:hypothetical protein